MDSLPERLREKGNKSYNPGEIIYVDSNNISKYDCFGVVVDKEFWMEQVKNENFLINDINRTKELGHTPLEKMVLFRVLGTKAFRVNDDERFEPDNHAIMHYRFQYPVYVTPVNLRPLIEISKKEKGKIGELLFNESNSYVSEALNDAEVVYRYLDGERFNPDKQYHFKENKLLRILEKAIPLKD